MELLNSTWEWEDLFKMLYAVMAGVILGVEREMKDKSAGFKTISIICLGSTLFTILSYKVGLGESEDATRIASYVVSGIGFLGAGVIFKEGGNINGLTTASIIWISAAIGMSIGFGQYVTACIFLMACFFIILVGKLISKHWIRNTSKILEIKLNSKDPALKKSIYRELKNRCKSVQFKQMRYTMGEALITFDINIQKSNLNNLDEYLLSHEAILEFNY